MIGRDPTPPDLDEPIVSVGDPIAVFELVKGEWEKSVGRLIGYARY